MSDFQVLVTGNIYLAGSDPTWIIHHDSDMLEKAEGADGGEELEPGQCRTLYT